MDKLQQPTGTGWWWFIGFIPVIVKGYGGVGKRYIGPCQHLGAVQVYDDEHVGLATEIDGLDIAVEFMNGDWHGPLIPPWEVD